MINKLNSIIKKFCDCDFVENIPENKLRKKKKEYK
jgi:hypothetical protein